MPRYYFDLTNAEKPIRDNFGGNCAGDDEARFEAVALLFEIAREQIPEVDQYEHVMTVRNEAGAVVYEASLSLSGRWWPGRR